MTFLEEWRNTGQVKYKCKIIDRLISIKVLWKSFHPNIPIKSKLQTAFIILQTSCIIIHHHLSSYIIIHHHTSSFIIIHHHSSLYIIIHHHTSSCIIIDHHTLSYQVLVVTFVYTFYEFRSQDSPALSSHLSGS